VVARALCRFSRFDLTSIPVKRRAQALQLQLRQWTPFGQPEFAIIFEKNAALVWCWDAAWLQAQRQNLPALWKNAEAIPETALQTPPADGARLIQCLDGVEAQFWQQGELRASRWWSAVPELSEFIAFCREVGHPLAQVQQLPEVLAPITQAQPWLPVMTAANLSAQNPLLEQAMYAALFLIVALPYGWYNLREYQLDRAMEGTRAEMKALTGQANSLVQAREAALKAVDEISSRQRLDPYPTQIELMTAVAEALPSDATIREWEFQENKLRIVIAGGLEVPSRADITKALTQSDMFTDIQNLLARDTKALSFRMTVLPKNGIQPEQDKSVDGKDNNG